MTRPVPVVCGPQYWDTTCMICGERQFAAVPDVICNSCLETSKTTDYIKALEDVLVFSIDEIKSQYVLRFDCDFESAGEENPAVKKARSVLKGG